MSTTQMGFPVLTLLLAAAIACSPTPQKPEHATVNAAGPAEADSQAAHLFVQRFYDWYTASTAYGTASAGFKQVLVKYLDVSLADALRADSAAREDSVQFRRSVDFDPFLNSQDPCSRYEVVSVRRLEGKFGLTLRPVCANATAQQYQNKLVTVEVARQSGEWRILDVAYSEGRTLKGLLCGLAQDDSRPEKRPVRCP